MKYLNPKDLIEVGFVEIERLPHGEVSRYLLEAVKLLENWGWTQKTLHSADGYCIRGALLQVLELPLRNTADISMIEACEKLICKAIHRPYSGEAIPRWNDQLGRTKQEVISALKRAAYFVEPEIEYPREEYPRYEVFLHEFITKEFKKELVFVSV